jgi:hypothetical protein
MKIHLSVAIDKPVADALIRFCKKVIGDITYKRSKSDVVNEAVREYLLKHGEII